MSSTVKITLYAKPEVKERLQELADADRRSISEFCLLTLERAFGGTLEPRPEAVGAARDGSGVHVPVLERVAPPREGGSPARKPRTVTCEHRLAPDQYCAACDG